MPTIKHLQGNESQNNPNNPTVDTNSKYWLVNLLQRGLYGQDQAISLGVDKFRSVLPPPEMRNQIPAPQLPSSEPDLQNAVRSSGSGTGVQVWVDNGLSGNHSNHNHFNQSRVIADMGSQVEDPYLDTLRQRSSSSDMQERAAFYDQIDIGYINCGELTSARESLLRDAFAQDVDQEIIPAKGYEKSERALEMVRSCAVLWNDLSSTITVDHRTKRMREHISYGNGYIQCIPNEYGIIERTRALPAKTIKINSNQDLLFYPNQIDAYQQYTRDVWTHPRAWWPEDVIIPLLNTMFESDRYGWPYCLPVLSYIRGLIRSGGTLADAREAGLPRVIEAHEDPLGNPVPEETVLDRRVKTRSARMARGEHPNAYEHDVINGKVTVSMLEPNGRSWSETKDLEWFANNICALFARSYGKQALSSEMNRATLDRITENDYETAYMIALLFFGMHDKPLLEKMIYFANIGAAKTSQYYKFYDKNGNIDLKKLYIDTRMVQLRTKVRAKRLPERLAATAELTAIGYGANLVSQRTAVEVFNTAIDVEHDSAEEIRRLQAEGKWGKSPDNPAQIQQLKPSLPKTTPVLEPKLDKQASGLIM